MPPHSIIDHDDSSSMKHDDIATESKQPLLLEMEMESHNHHPFDHNDSNHTNNDLAIGGHHHDEDDDDRSNNSNKINDDDVIMDEEDFEDILLEDYNVWDHSSDEDIFVPPIIPMAPVDYSSDTEEYDENPHEPTPIRTTTTLIHNATAPLTITAPSQPSFAFALPVKKRKNRKSVKFDAIKIREYTQVLGDHPCCTFGPPISLGWQYIQNDNMALDEYETTRQPRRTRRELRLTWDVRRAKLSEFDSDVTDGEVRAVQRKIFRERSCRIEGTGNNTKAFFGTAPIAIPTTTVVSE